MKRPRASPLVLATMLATILAPTKGWSGKVYWTDRGAGKVQRADLDGKAVETLVTFPAASNLRGISIDTRAAKIYFADNGSDSIFQVDLDGRNQKVLAKDLGFPADVYVDGLSQTLYWCDQVRNRIQRIRLDGSELETVHETAAPYFLDLDVSNRHLYWGYFGAAPNRDRPNIFRIDLDSPKEASEVIRGLHQVRGVKLDVPDRRIYWCDREAHKIQRAQLDGSDMEDIVTGLDTPHGMVLDNLARVMYWADTGTNRVPGSRGAQAVNRSSMDGGVPVRVLVKASQPWDLDLDLRTQTFAEWQARFFLEEGVEPRSPNGDPDGDQLTNVFEYALASQPLRKDDPGTLYRVTERVEDGRRFGVLQFRRFQGTKDLTYRIEVSSDGKQWHYNGDASGREHTSKPNVNSLPDALEKVEVATVASAEPGAMLFMRLRAILKESS